MDTLKSKELSESLKCIIKNIQRTSFYNEIQYLEKGIPLPNSCKLLNLNPFLDDSGLLRVGGRLRNSPIPRNKKHSMIIPTNHNFTYIIINHYHILYFHTGAEATLANIRNSFWIPSARNVVRKILRTCITCRKVSAKGSQQLMADLPAARVTACRVFSQVGIDYCGPFQLKTFSGKCRQTRKVYVCVFICFTVKAIHSEIVSDLTTEAFLAALKWFVARRGRPIEIHSDNGRNFVGANNELRKILKALFKGKMEEIMDFLSKEQIKWNFNPPSALHFGGLWEAGVKSLKYHLKRVIGNSILSHEEFLTLVVQIEVVLNSRPICPLSNDPNDVETLTPAHFLVGSSLVAVPDPDYTEIPMNRLSRWQLVQRMNQHFWRKWSSEYLNRLQQRPKWCKGNVGFKEGDLVLVKPSENSDSLKWHLARILKLHTGKDNIVRVVTLKDKQGIYKSPITKIANLPYVN
ncbi:integrase catalytic domain-containing protein [Trichonephila clavipes]|nr:integrase catalytic domain-containing protein [Trichonephila clavipes]